MNVRSFALEEVHLACREMGFACSSFHTFLVFCQSCIFILVISYFLYLYKSGFPWFYYFLQYMALNVVIFQQESEVREAKILVGWVWYVTFAFYV